MLSFFHRLTKYENIKNIKELIKLLKHITTAKITGKLWFLFSVRQEFPQFLNLPKEMIDQSVHQQIYGAMLVKF